MIVFFTVPPDLLYDLTYGDPMIQEPNLDRLKGPRSRVQSASDPWQVEESYGTLDEFDGLLRDNASRPVEICGQTITACDSLVEIALDSSPDMVVWAFSSLGWAKTWSLDMGRPGRLTTTAIQQDGSVHVVDRDGDVAMARSDDAKMSKTIKITHSMGGPVNPFDGTAAASFAERRCQLQRARASAKGQRYRQVERHGIGGLD
jgi:hypothetical protein